MPTRRRRSLLTALLTATLAAACEPGSPGASAGGSTEPARLVLFDVSAGPILEIGVLEGDADYVFDRVVSVLPLPDGRLAVADGGSNRISLYRADGTFVERWGGDGDGPGEFRAVTHLAPWTGDSILAADGRDGRVSVLGPDGGYAREVPGEDLSGDSAFVLDDWLHHRFRVAGSLREEERARVRSTLDSLPAPAPGYRLVMAGREGRLWIREGGGAAPGTTRWVVTAEDGSPERLVDLPSAFLPLHIDGNALVGRWVGARDVHFVRRYEPMATGETASVPAWLTAPRSAAAGAGDSGSADPGLAAADVADLESLLRATARQVAVAQEMHYARKMSYSTETDSLELERPDGLELEILHADARGWAMVATLPGLDRACGLAYGAGGPAGWTPGTILCSR